MRGNVPSKDEKVVLETFHLKTYELFSHPEKALKVNKMPLTQGTYLSLGMQNPVRGPWALKMTASSGQVLFNERHFLGGGTMEDELEDDGGCCMHRVGSGRHVTPFTS